MIGCAGDGWEYFANKNNVNLIYLSWLGFSLNAQICMDPAFGNHIIIKTIHFLCACPSYRNPSLVLLHKDVSTIPKTHLLTIASNHQYSHSFGFGGNILSNRSAQYSGHFTYNWNILLLYPQLWIHLYGHSKKGWLIVPTKVNTIINSIVKLVFSLFTLLCIGALALTVFFSIM